MSIVYASHVSYPAEIWTQPAPDSLLNSPREQLVDRAGPGIGPFTRRRADRSPPKATEPTPEGEEALVPPSQARARSTALTSWTFGTAPTIWSFTSPLFRITRLGMPRTPKRAGVAGLSSTFILTTLSRPA